jgi:FkbM family methyltransferase
MILFKIVTDRLIFAIRHGLGYRGKISMLVNLFSSSKELRPIRLKSLSEPLYVQNGSDIAMAIECFLYKEYQLDPGIQPKRILDIGANIGCASLYFLSHFKNAEIAAVEPDPQNLVKLEKNTKIYKNIKILNYAIDAQVGEKNFFTQTHAGMSSSFSKRFPHQKEIEVKTQTLDGILSLLNWQSYDVLKFDVEGAEWEIFSQMPQNLPTIIIGEFHEDLTGHTVSEFIALFKDYIVHNKQIARSRYILKFIKK